MISVINISSRPIKVAISQWDCIGSTKYWNINSHASESWDRSDKRGFIMSLMRENDIAHPYFVLFDSNIMVTDTAITDNNKVL